MFAPWNKGCRNSPGHAPTPGTWVLTLREGAGRVSANGLPIGAVSMCEWAMPSRSPVSAMRWPCRGGSGAVDRWWFDVDPTEAVWDARRPQLVKRVAVPDRLERELVLVPPSALRSRAHLRSPGYGQALCWCVDAGRRAVASRAWCVGGKPVDLEQHTTPGADLLVRTDMFDTLLHVHGGPLKALQRGHISGSGDVQRVSAHQGAAKDACSAGEACA